ncbi:hypothetical protein K490DRAFT_52577 [Saccharata proteae CBS 121410]|uniref:SP-RING-type domain-containing protein n=1 Tax=Saccharata proteae CBS 121410 TaxID=1314787 RepID=A0A9P4I3V2_9PEZI|nr:hypothetical protein K490DRAFT_52577 [Saccharata proteae CBS 121410]
MSSRARYSTAGPSTARTPAPPSSSVNPAYQPLAHPLNETGLRDLRNLRNQNHLRKLQEHVRQAVDSLTDAAALMNERSSTANDNYQKRKKKLERDGKEPTEDDEKSGEHVKKLKQDVETMTGGIEAAVRQTIDAEQTVKFMEDSLETANSRVSVNAAAAQSQTQRSQRRQRGMDDGEDMPDFDPTLPGTAPATQVVVPSNLFRQRIESDRNRYQALSHYTRYGQNNHYIGFKKAVHESSHPTDSIAPPLPNAKTWFSEAGPPPPGVTNDDSDDDIAIASEKISTKCPLTLQELKEPVKSRLCPHSYEKKAMIDLIRQGGVHTVQCPVTGCAKMLTEHDLVHDASLTRKIKRIQQARNDVMSDDEEDSRMPESVDSGDDIDDVDDATDVQRPRKKSVAPKMEQTLRPRRNAGGGGSIPIYEYDETYA